MTIKQVGLPAFKVSPGTIHLSREIANKSPQQVLRERARDDSQGIFGFLKTTNKTWTVTFNEDDPSSRFKIVHEQELASGAATDKRDWTVVDPRCTRGEGPIPVQCRSASCGTCWIGVLGGAEKLSPVATREARKIKEFGYISTDEPQPIIRLACQAQGLGAVSIVLPPWNGVFGKFVYGQQQQSGEAEQLPRK
ncbi:MAG: (2Fe-2S)-binding protein [Pyrinomonadaceae bacterium]|nr:(2Fe-2S)-binding protein [Pyrinomonadaceae bacterium]